MRLTGIITMQTRFTSGLDVFVGKSTTFHLPIQSNYLGAVGESRNHGLVWPPA